ncbi:PEP-CTERM sorting domain-containing protein [Kamptonema formosum]|uniref:PEP-CTERM sorting domain-containing protein n=1 Tax=Kamptonema formosum TaxID=331992 RepID=UPI00036AAA0D|nr:PEP-CTERM sorting domain-containing protein [Oscillatoria sp. PCC 10802]
MECQAVSGLLLSITSLEFSLIPLVNMVTVNPYLFGEIKIMATLTLMKKLSLTIVGAVFMVFGTGATVRATTFYVSTDNGKVGTVNHTTGVFSPVSSGPTFSDIALSNSEELFGITFSELYRINTTTGISSYIGNLGNSMNGLGFTTSNSLYGTGGAGFYSINTSTGAASLVSNIAGFSSSGDIVYDPVNNRFLGTSVGDSLWSIALDGTASKIGNIGFGGVYGLAFDDHGVLYGYTGNRQQIIINLATGIGTFNQSVTGFSGEIWGSASLPSTGPQTSVPEPGTVFGLLGVGALGAGSMFKCKKQKKATGTA